jgi:hypothetical protein
MIEAVCRKCGETFIPAGEDPDDLIHGQTEAEEPCGGVGVVVGEWIRTPGSRSYLVSLPVLITVHDDGRVEYDVDTTEAATAVAEESAPADDVARIAEHHAHQTPANRPEQETPQ